MKAAHRFCVQIGHGFYTTILRPIFLQYFTQSSTITQTKNRDTATFAVCIAVFTLAE